MMQRRSSKPIPLWPSSRIFVLRINEFGLMPTRSARWPTVGSVINSNSPFNMRRDGRVAEGARLESVFTAR